ncbi:MAG: hydrogenase maturation factor [Lachnospiraceae bacterium]|nr:hydrogenase maturation factor [Lachnospiraceae bacterium]
MNYGKVSESVYKRTVYKTIHTTGYFDKETEKGAVLGADCAFLASTVTASGQAWGKDAMVATRAAQHALNHLAALGALRGTAEESAVAYVSLNINIPAEYREAKLRAVLEKVTKTMADMRVSILTTEVQVIPSITTVLVTAHAYTHAAKEDILVPGEAKAEQDVVMTKWLGLEGTATITDRKLRELQTRYPAGILDEVAAFEQYLSIIPEAATAAKSGVSAMQVVREGGIFGALWELAEESDVGLVIDLKKIPVKQETIEVCEFFDANPYKLLSGGSLLFTTDKGMDLVALLEEQGIAATVIGKTIEGNDRILMNEDEKRFLEPAREDELYKVLA